MKIKIDIKKWWLIILSAIVMAGYIYVDKSILVTSFEQCLYAFIKMDNSSSSPIIYATLYILLFTIIIFPLYLLPVVDFGKKFVMSIKNKSFNIYPIKRVKLYGIILLFVGFISLLCNIKFFTFVKNRIFSSTEIFDDYYVDSSSVDITFPEDKKNLIYIFVESLEMSNVSTTNSGLFDETIIPNLEKMASENINFSNNDKLGGAYSIDGAGWTSAAMVAQTSGIPVKFSFGDLKPNSNAFTKVTSIGDILSDNGYNSYLLLGSDASFGGRRSYFANHDYLIKDYISAIDDGKIDEDYYVWWGYEDAKLFEYAREMLLDISLDDKPFNFTMLTADTHFTDGYLDKSCDNEFDDDYANSFYCSDKMIYEFINWIKEQDFYDDTVIVIVGDHLTMQDNFYKEYDYYDRTIYNTFINVDINSKYNSKNRVFTTLDMFPTTLAALGADIEGDRLGLGTNLFSDKKTIPEMIGIEEFNVELTKGSHYYFNNIKD